PLSVIPGAANELLVVEQSNNTVRRIDLNSPGAVTTVAGAAAVPALVNDKGALARFNAPIGLAYDSQSATLYVADQGNNVIRKLTVDDGTASPLAGSGTLGSTDNPAAFARPNGV